MAPTESRTSLGIEGSSLVNTSKQHQKPWVSGDPQSTEVGDNSQSCFLFSSPDLRLSVPGSLGWKCWGSEGNILKAGALSLWDRAGQEAEVIRSCRSKKDPEGWERLCGGHEDS